MYFQKIKLVKIIFYTLLLNLLFIPNAAFAKPSLPEVVSVSPINGNSSFDEEIIFTAVYPPSCRKPRV